MYACYVYVRVTVCVRACVCVRHAGGSTARSAARFDTSAAQASCRCRLPSPRGVALLRHKQLQPATHPCGKVLLDEKLRRHCDKKRHKDRQLPHLGAVCCLTGPPPCRGKRSRATLLFYGALRRITTAAEGKMTEGERRGG